MRLHILLSVVLLGNVAVFSVGFRWSGREDSDSEKAASANSNGGEWQVAGKRPKPRPPKAIAERLANTIYTSAAGKLQARPNDPVRSSEFGFLYVNYDLNEKEAVLQREILNKMPGYSKNQPPTMISGNLYVSEVTYPPEGQPEANNYGHVEHKLLNVLNNKFLASSGSGCPLFVIVGTRLPPCRACMQDIKRTQSSYRPRPRCERTYFYVFIGKTLTLSPV